MTPLLRLLAIWGLVDAAWLVADPPGWARFWGRFVAGVGANPRAARALGAVEALICLTLLLVGRRRAELASAPARPAEPTWHPARFAAALRRREAARPGRSWYRVLARSA